MIQHTIRLIVYALTLPLLGLTVSCSGKGKPADSDTRKATVVVTIPPLEYFARGIGGDMVETVCLIPASADPETFEPTITQLKKAAKADVLLSVGILPFEKQISSSISSSSSGSGITVANLADSVVLVAGTHGHDEADPHIWTSYRNARIMARHTYRALVDALPSAATYFRHRLDSIEARLDSLDRHTAERLKPLQGEYFLVWHPSLTYFARDYGLTQLAVGSEHKESSLAGLKEQLDNINLSDVNVFFFQKEFDSRQSKVISSATGLQPVMIEPMSDNPEQTLSAVTESLVKSITNTQ